ncbi:hypothetical protein C7B62_19430 [Pleurocapsa sp. CCALA 161]|uniref:phospholipase effector Tle1 domain-containing protein n=1 Tax=Pleurocapsa sp. CCALA 161 TaxID=2107688 RepID=UPI000D06D71A|nr:DUF2235 domain-containing protein [Pleurocapsa sp. CCALA 161]PSB07597.1 hypothetical protein C7B62_19430 [Pleurocapsa sp. CCALA 161]
MKRLIVCCDGTWQSQDNEVPTNVFKIAQAVKQVDEQEDNISQVLYYDQGIGTVPSRGGTQSFLQSIGDSLEKLGGGAFGWWIPDFTPLLLIDEFFSIKYQFHDTRLSPIIENARHAIALDEKQKALKVCIMNPGEAFNGTLKQVWFPGNHGCIGGGTAETKGLSNAALKWMADEASQVGLHLDLDLAEDTQIIDYKTPFDSILFLIL